MPIKLTIGERIAAARTALKLSQVELSELTGFGKTRISNWETGFRTPKLKDAKVLEKHLKIPAPYLLCLSENQESLDDLEQNKAIFKSIPIYDEVALLNVEQSTQLCTVHTENYLPLLKSNEILSIQDVFAFELYDDSMSPEFNKNDIVVFKPTNKIRHNDFALVKIRDSKEIVFRKYFLDNTNINQPIINLIPNNDHWVTNQLHSPSEFVILGVSSNIRRLFL